MKNAFVFIPLLALSGCALHASFTPENSVLTDAIVGKPYYAQITIAGGRVAKLTDIHGNNEFVANISPENYGLYVQHCNNDEHDNNCVQVRGTPTKEGVVKIRVSGFFNVSMLDKSSDFDKTYTVHIKNP